MTKAIMLNRRMRIIMDPCLPIVRLQYRVKVLFWYTWTGASLTIVDHRTQLVHVVNRLKQYRRANKLDRRARLRFLEEFDRRSNDV